MPSDIKNLLHQFNNADADLYDCLVSLKKNKVNEEHLLVLNQAVQDLGDKVLSPIDLSQCDQQALLKIKEKILKINPDKIQPKSISLMDRIRGFLSSKADALNKIKQVEYQRNAEALKTRIRSTQSSIQNLSFQYTLNSLFEALFQITYAQQPSPDDKGNLIKLKNKIEAIKPENVANRSSLISSFVQEFFPRDPQDVLPLKKEVEEAQNNIAVFLQAVQTKTQEAHQRLSNYQTDVTVVKALDELKSDYREASHSIFQNLTTKKQVAEICQKSRLKHEVKNQFNKHLTDLKVTKKTRLKHRLDALITDFIKEKDIEIAINNLNNNLLTLYMKGFDKTEVDPSVKKTLYTLLSIRALKHPEYATRILTTYVPPIFRNRTSYINLTHAQAGLMGIEIS